MVMKKLCFFIAIALLLSGTMMCAAAEVHTQWYNVNDLVVNVGTNFLDMTYVTSTPPPLSNVPAAMIHSTPYSTVVGYIRNGINGGAWNGTSQAINSSPAAVEYGVNGYTTIGGMTGNDALNTAMATKFFGQPMATGDTLLMYTYYGDCDLNGMIDDTDLGYFNYAYQSQDPTSTGWLWGDNDWSGGLTDDTDLGYFNYMYQTVQSLGGQPYGQYGPGLTYSKAGGAQAVPEPSTIVLLSAAAALFVFLRKR
jgi:hypothetical protein